MSTRRILGFFGTRPEAIKLWPVVRALRDTLRENAGSSYLRLVNLNQQPDLLPPILRDLEMGIWSTAAPPPADGLGVIHRHLMAAAESAVSTVKPHMVLVQGDTASALAGAMAAFNAKVPVAHVEAGLRTRDIYSPFPEEMHRRLISQLATLHFCPTREDAYYLLNERHIQDGHEVYTVGNTVVDALVAMSQGRRPGWIENLPQEKLVLVTLHRREHWEDDARPLVDFLGQLNLFASERRDVTVLWPLHPNPVVHEHVTAAKLPANVLLKTAIRYSHFVHLLARATAIITDSGGVQEEAAALARFCVVYRRETERPAVLKSTCRLAYPAEPAFGLVRAVLDHGLPPPMVWDELGDGAAGATIARLIEDYLERTRT